MRYFLRNSAPLLGFIAALACAAPQTADAEQVVATTIVDGKKVELLDNNSWRFVASGNSQSNCSTVAGDVTFCGARNVWQPIQPPNAQIAAAFLRSEKHYGIVISEGIGTNSGISVDSMRQIAIQNAANGAGILAKDVAVADAFTSQANGVSYSTVAYSVTINGIPIFYLNSIYVGPDRALQMITYELDRSLTQYHRELHQEFLDATLVAQ